MYRRAYVLLVGIAAVMGILAIVAALSTHKSLADPDGFLGPSWLRLPMLILAAFAVDLVPRTLWQSRFKPGLMADIFRTRVRTHWTRERATLVVLGVLSFYITYVSYRNLKSFLPFVVNNTKYDRTLHLMDRALVFGHEPGLLLHDVLGTGFTAYFLSYVYLWFLPLVPLALTAWLVWSRNMSYGYWFATSQCIAWSLGTLSYYALPTLGPGIAYSYIYTDLPDTPTAALMSSLQNTRNAVVQGGIEDVVQSIAGFASLHCAITLLVALMVQFTLRSKVLKTVFWVNFGFTVIATIYFGWHYIADDVAGIMIAFVSFYVGGLASGQKFERHGLASHPTTTTSAIPVDQDA
ncbi:phosphatase PAP2 family protein [Nocardioides sp. KIGAM211]|uniref:Phosphatase PAP2 family protein n=1 Tax=Nocardioides luti TaxID=2761101 RepID=A0A7X0VAD2_9ACTN|nr:phosphatase PAP2 family protein [Nocardioides luti]